MKCFRMLGFLVVIGAMADAALAQSGLYGAPRLVRLPPTNEGAIESPQESSLPADRLAPPEPQPLAGAPANEPILVSVEEPRDASGAPQLSGPGNYSRVARTQGPVLKPVPDARSSGPEPVPPSVPVDPPGQAAASSPAKTPPAAPRSLVHQMLDEAGGCGSTYQPSPEFQSALANSGQAECDPGCGPVWYASAAGLILTRDRGNRVVTTFETGVPGVRLMDTEHAHVDWSGGYEIRLGRRFAEGLWAVEGSYWRVDGLKGSARQLPVNVGATLSTPLAVDGIEFGGVNGAAFFNNAGEHRLSRSDVIDNIEINLIRCHVADAEGLWELNWSMGARYFRFLDDLTFGAAIAGGGFGGDLTDEAFLRDRVANNLIGGQVGLDARYYLGYNLSIAAAPRIGLYNNHITNRFLAYRGDGLAANPTAISGFTGSFPVASSKDVVSFLGQVDLTMDWQFHPNWNAFIGYRFVAATSIAQADAQFAQDIADPQALSLINHNGSLVVHGGFAGLTFRF